MTGPPIQFTTNYRPFGPTYGTSGSETFMYTDKPHDTATGLYYYGARFYDPSVGRFITQDSYNGTVRDPLSQNRYIYAEDNPLRYVDPTGHDACHASPDACYGGPQTPMDELTWFLTDYVWTSLPQLVLVIAGLIVTVWDPALVRFLGNLDAAVAKVLATDVMLVPDTGLVKDLANGDVNGAAHDVLGLTGDVLNVFWSGLNFIQQAEIFAEGAGYYGLDALTAGTLSEAATTVGMFAVIWSFDQYLADANTAYQSYESACTSGGSC